MTGPQNSSYLWVDERNKKVKYSAPQYIDLSMMFIQKTLSDETIFPTRLGKKINSLKKIKFFLFAVFLRSTISFIF